MLFLVGPRLIAFAVIAGIALLTIALAAVAGVAATRGKRSFLRISGHVGGVLLLGVAAACAFLFYFSAWLNLYSNP